MVQMIPEVTDKNAVLATIPYKPMGACQYLTLIRHKDSVRQCDSLLTDWTELQKTVLSQAFFGRPVVIDTGLWGQGSFLQLPTLTRAQLDLKLGSDSQGRPLGYVARVPGLWVHANRILQRIPGYDVELAVCQMVREAVRMMVSVVQNGILRVREKPGIMAHALELPELGHDEIGISLDFAKKIMLMIKKQELPIHLETPWDLDGFPVYAVRFPVANRHGIQEMTLRVLKGQGRYLAINPWNLGKRFLGDRDGDCLFALLRVTEASFGKFSLRPRVRLDSEFTLRESPMSLRSVLDPSNLSSWNEKLAEKFVAPNFSTRESRLQWVEDADRRGHVAVYTMAIGWWVARVLMMNGMNTQQAYEKSHDALEWFLESAMDGRKGNSPLAKFDSYAFMDTLLRGGELDFKELKEIGVPDETLNTLRLAWITSGKNLRDYCSRSPIYEAFVLQRGSMEKATTSMLLRLKKHGIQPDTLYHTIIRDLTGSQILDVREVTATDSTSEEKTPTDWTMVKA